MNRNNIESFGRLGVFGCLAILINQTEFYQNYNPTDITNPLAIGFSVGIVLVTFWVLLPMIFPNNMQKKKEIQK